MKETTATATAETTATANGMTPEQLLNATAKREKIAKGIKLGASFVGGVVVGVAAYIGLKAITGNKSEGAAK